MAHSLLALLSSTSAHHSFKCAAAVFVKVLPKYGGKITTDWMWLFVHGIQSCLPIRLRINTQEFVAEPL